MEYEIRERLARYLAGESGLTELEDWLVPGTWDIDEQGQPSAAMLAYSIQLALAERAAGHLDSGELDRRLRGLLETAQFGSSAASEVTASAATTQQAPFRVAAADRRFAAVFG